MGQRHQAWIIAKVVPHGGGRARYRCIGGLHHQWCYGTLPIKAVLRMATLLGQKSNAQIVKEELRSIEGKYGPYMAETPNIPDVPCPYTAFLLYLAFTVDMDPASLSGLYLHPSSKGNALSATSDCWFYDNNDGLTIIDVTNPYSMKYCFLPGCETNTRDEGILTAQQYLYAYYDVELEDPKFRVSLEDVLKASKGLGLVSGSALSEAWPSTFKIGSTTDEEPEESGDKSVPSLMSLTVGPAVKQAVETGSMDGLPVLLQADKLALVIEALRLIEAPFPDSGMPLVARVVEIRGDFSALPGVQLTGEQLTKIIPAGEALDELDLAGNAALTIGGLHTLLAHVPRIRRLVLIHTGISDDEFFDLLRTPARFAGIEELIHPLLYSWTCDAFPAVFTIFDATNAGRMSFGPPDVISAPLLSLRLLTEGLRIFATGLASGENSLTFTPCPTAFEAVLSTGSIPVGRPWAERSVWCTPTRTRYSPTGGSWMLVLSWSNYGLGAKKYGLLRDTGAEGDGLELKSLSPKEFLDSLPEQGFPVPSAEEAQSFLAVFEELERAGSAPMKPEDYQAIPPGLF
ncbi:hypothetical protein HDZ31DRAFT_62099 [Schizophyllum fasciatum]